MSFCVMKIRYVKLFISHLCMTNFTYSKFIGSCLFRVCNGTTLHYFIPKLQLKIAVFVCYFKKSDLWKQIGDNQWIINSIKQRVYNNSDKINHSFKNQILDAMYIFGAESLLRRLGGRSILYHCIINTPTFYYIFYSQMLARLVFHVCPQIFSEITLNESIWRTYNTVLELLYH